ncbi:Histone deacetylase hda1 [Tulasnella sp. 418]|nr:Histone deacetylase hda1 [Tulasnella sp. 418]
MDVIVDTDNILEYVAPEGSLKPRAGQTGYIYDDRMMLHSPFIDTDGTDSEHPEQPLRVKMIDDKLREHGCIGQMRPIPIRHLLQVEALLVHSADHWEKVEAIADMDAESIAHSRTYYEHLSLYIHPRTPEAALLSAGGVIEATLAVARGQVKNSFANVRPPGHHAEPDEHMGFCFFNNVAIAARAVQLETSIRKILILDWDVHHGNGTQRAFYDDPSILYISLHRYDGGEFYPSGLFGGMEACGEGQGVGKSVNIPWPRKGIMDADYLYAFLRIVMPIAYEFNPELVIISAGFDAADGDKLGECHVTPAGFAHMTHMLCSLANGKVVVALEGGYNLQSISNSALAVAEILLGGAPPMMPEQSASDVVTETVWQVAKIQSRYWKSIDVKLCEPKDEVKEEYIDVSVLLKAYRAQYMSEKLNTYVVPFADDSIQSAFDGQVFCSTDIWERSTLVFFIHDYGSLRAELQGARSVDVDLENSYLLDASHKLADWVLTNSYSLLDVNVFPQAIEKGVEDTSLIRRILIYLWDNYIEITDASNVIIIASGQTCKCIPLLLTDRDVSTKVKAVVQVIGSVHLNRLPLMDDDLRSWYKIHSLVLMTSTHPKRFDKKFHDTHGKVIALDGERPSQIFVESMPHIQEFVTQQLAV